jgi:exopolyphosphatase/guanosine-5'-triphosphate,3'-diphosphate pyrophosphatase
VSRTTCSTSRGAWSWTWAAVHAIQEILRAQGFSEDGITLEGLKRLRKALIAAGSTSALELQSLKPERARVLAGGLAILLAVFKNLHLDTMRRCNSALREGVLYDLIGRIRHEDIRDRTIRRMVDRYHVDLAQSERVRRTSLLLLEQVVTDWNLEPEAAAHLLTWAAQLHEVGLAVSHTGFHKHGAYLIANSEMPGFSSDDQLQLAALVRGQRRKLAADLFSGLPGGRLDPTIKLCVLLRLAVLLNRGRVADPQPHVRVLAARDELSLDFPSGWLAEHALTRADLEQEASWLNEIGIRLVVRQAREASDSR